MKINCDMGESFGAWHMGMDEQVMPNVDMANIACGFHASDPSVMDKTVRLAKKHGVTIGAHPGYPDLQGFGRRDLKMAADDIRAMILYQTGALEAICRAADTHVSYVKPHGALYNNMISDPLVMSAIMDAMVDLGGKYPLVVMAVPEFREIEAQAAARGITVWFEAFSDRAYDDQGRLVSRSLPGAVHQEFGRIEQQVKELVHDGMVTSISGQRIPIKADTVCIHGDGLHAADIAAHLRQVVTG